MPTDFKAPARYLRPKRLEEFFFLLIRVEGIPIVTGDV